jgi:DNA helicase HerA-like ATPase
VTLGWPELTALGTYRITELPRPDLAGFANPPPDPGRTQRAAALLAAYHAGVDAKADGAGALAMGWVRHRPGGPVHLLTAGPGLVGGRDGREVLLTLPGGARAELLRGGALAALMSELPSWRAISVIDIGSAAEAGLRTPPSLEECLLAVWPGAFGWLLVAEPRQGAPAGMWRIRLAAGGADPDAAARVAGLVCASADLTGLPYAVAPAEGDARGLAELMGETSPALMDDTGPAPAGRDGAPGHPGYASTELIAALARPPEREIPGVRLALRPDFDVTQEAPGAQREAIAVGEILDRNRQPAGPLTLALDSLNRHVLVCGAAGTGKSQTVRALLEAATGAGIPWLVVEPAKAEYRLMAARLSADGAGRADVVRIRPGESDAIAAGLNPLEPAVDAGGRRFPLQAHADLVQTLFTVAFRSPEPVSQVLGAALSRAYEEAGWDLVLGETITADPNPGYPRLSGLQRAAIRIVREVGYGERVADDVLGFLAVRLSGLRLGGAGRFLQGGHQLDFGKLLRTNAVLELQDVADDQVKTFLIGTVLIRLSEHLRLAHQASPGRLRHLTVIEEARRLLRRPDAVDGGAAAQAVETFAALLAELGAYGEGMVIAEQNPGRLTGNVLENTAVKIAHRLPAAGDRAAVGATMNLTRAQDRFLVILRPGEAAVFADGMDHPLLTLMPDGTGREAAAQGATASPAGIVRARSTTCGPDCTGRPCTLRDMRVAQRALAEYPAFRLWAELSVVGHLVGWPMPVPRTALLSLLQMMPSRLRDCAISHAVDTAVSARAPVIVRRVSPVGLAAHVSTAIRAWLSGGSWLCQREEPRWLAPAYQWTLVLDALKTADRKNPGAGPHPRSAEWERTYGQAIAGDTVARQVGAVQRWYDGAQRDAWEMRAVAFGVDSPSAAERAVGAAAEDDDFEERLSGYLDQFVDCRWPRLYLTGDALGDPPEQPV